MIAPLPDKAETVNMTEHLPLAAVHQKMTIPPNVILEQSSTPTKKIELYQKISRRKLQDIIKVLIESIPPDKISEIQNIEELSCLTYSTGATGIKTKRSVMIY
ncbi:hypothetical protein GQX74_009724 [Glossina fuscipes]|nr:hypothetical protein GQX74_009724 [Glossina fuscipes]